MKRDASSRIGGSDEEKNKFRPAPDGGGQQGEQDNIERWLLAGPRDVLKAVKADGAGHQGGQAKSQADPRDRPAPVLNGPATDGVHGRSDDAGGCRSGHAYEILGAARSHALHVKAGETP